MARNSEKAQSMLYRFRESQAADLGILDAGRTRRPKVISEQTSLAGCERWRGQVLKEISRKVSKIQEPVLSDYQIRDLNDEINKLLREKHMWEVQIRNLGGPNYARAGTKEYDADGHEIPGGEKGYRYFGRARELPGVRELFEAARQKSAASRAARRDGDGYGDDLRRDVDAAYYGYGPDEEDSALLKYEANREAEAKACLAAAASLTAPKAKTAAAGKRDDENDKDDDGDDTHGLERPLPPDFEPLPGDTGDGKIWVLPTVEQVQHELLERRKQRILRQL